MSLLIDLPKDLSLTLLRNWLSLRDIVRLDSAVASQQLRQHWLEILSNEIITCSTVNLRDKDLAKLKWLMLRNAFCNKIAFRNCRIREYVIPDEFLFKWIQQSMHIKTLRFKEKTNITFHLLLHFLLIPFLQPPLPSCSSSSSTIIESGGKAVDGFELEQSGQLFLELDEGDEEEEEEEDGDPSPGTDGGTVGERGLKNMKLVSFRNLLPSTSNSQSNATRGEFFNQLNTTGIQPNSSGKFSYVPLFGTKMHRPSLNRFKQSHASNPPSESNNSSNPPNKPSSSNNLPAPFDVPLSPIQVIEQTDSMQYQPTSSLETELLTANIAHPLTAMEVIERMIQRTLTNLKENQRQNHQSFHQQKPTPVNATTTSFQEEGNDSSYLDINPNLSGNVDDAGEIDVIDDDDVVAPNTLVNNSSFNLLSSQPSLPEASFRNAINLRHLSAIQPIQSSSSTSNLSDQAINPNDQIYNAQKSAGDTETSVKGPSNKEANNLAESSKPPIRNQESNENSSEENVSGEEELNDIMMDSNKFLYTNDSTPLNVIQSKHYSSFTTTNPHLNFSHIFQNIEELYFHFHDISLLTSFFLQLLLPRVTKLKLFTVIDCMKVFDQDIILLIQSCPQIEEIMIDNCSMIQGLFFPELIKRSVNLNKIMLKHCQIINKSTPNPPANVQQLFALPFNTSSSASFGGSDHIIVNQAALMQRAHSIGSLPPADQLKLLRASSGGGESVKFHTKLTCCDFTHTRDIGDYILPYLLYYCPNVERINISFCHLSASHFNYLSMFCSRLKVLFLPGNTIDDEIIIPIVSNCQQLESMVIGFSPRVTDKTITAISKSLRFLKTFALWGNHKALNEVSMLQLVEGCTMLEKVALTYTGTTDFVLSILVNKCPLTRIEINGCQLLTDRCIESIAEQCSQRLTHFVAENVLFTDAGCDLLSRCGTLEYINLSNSKFITSKGIISILQSCAKIEILKLKECQLMNDELLIAIATYGKQLRELDISYIKHFSFSAILNILEKCEHLHKLFMIACFQDQLTQQLIDQTMIQEIIKIGTKKRIHIIH